MDDLNGGSFTISNSGIWGSLFGTPIINLPQTAVLGTYGIQERPVAVKGQVVIRPVSISFAKYLSSTCTCAHANGTSPGQMMYIALTYDHRIIDGREAVKFLVLIKKYLEDPQTMMLEI
jgi:2-oxoglutarate dehydrogenase E2 component (dihydrolipoamide succinyltransferase)